MKHIRLDYVGHSGLLRGVVVGLLAAIVACFADLVEDIMDKHNFRTTDTSSSEIIPQAVSTNGSKGSFVGRLLFERKLLLLRMLFVTVLMVLVSAAALVRQPARAAVGSAGIQLALATGVVLDFNEGSHKAGEVIPLARIFKENGITPVTDSLPDQCPTRHLHGVINICDPRTGKTEGPFPDPFNPNDQNPHECGHGAVIPYRANLSLTVGGPAIGSVGATQTYYVSATNLGPHTADIVNVYVLKVTFNGEELKPKSYEVFPELRDCDDILFCLFRGLRPFPTDVPRTVRYSLRIVDTDLLKDGDLAVTFAADTTAGCSDYKANNIDPDATNDIVTSVTRLTVDAESIPLLVKAFTEVGLFTSFDQPVAPFLIHPVDVGQGSIGMVNAAGVSNPLLLLPDSTGYGFSSGEIALPSDFKVVDLLGSDANGDGKQDMFFLGLNDDILFFPSLGDGTFGSPTLTPGDNNKGVAFSSTEIASNPFILRISSASAASQVDGVAVAAQTGILSILKGDKRGAFQRLSTISLPGVPSAIVAGDFNGDKKTDAVVALLGATDGSRGSVLLFLGDGAGNFTASGMLTAGVKPSAIAAGDFNSDSNLDLAVANHDSNDVSIFLGNGAGGFSLETAVPVGTNPVDIVAGDFNGNGKLDLGTANQGSNDVTIVLGDGKGRYIPTSVPVGQKPSSLVAADFNRDGKLDLAVANSGSGNISILVNGATPITRPVITSAEISGKKLLVTGSRFDNGSVILVDGVEQGTANDGGGPTTMLIAKKGGKKIKPGRTALIQVKTSAGIFSEAMVFTRTSQ